MIYRTLGRTGLEVSVVGFGASPLGNEFGQADEDEAIRAVHRAVDVGINYFDVSPYYGRTLAETRLGQALAGHRDRIILATKAGRYGVDVETGFDFSARRIRRSIDESLTRLKTDVIDVFQVHDLEFGRTEQIINETLPAMHELKRAGKVRFIGITGYPLGVLKRVAESDDVDTILSYCRYNLMDTSMDDVLTSFAQQRGIGLINASPLHMRVLTEKGPPDWHPAPPEVLTAARAAAEHCRRRGVDVADLALQFALSHETVATTLVGMSKVRHVDGNAELVGVSPDLDLLAEVRDIVRPVADTCWRSGRPENDDPGAIDR